MPAKRAPKGGRRNGARLCLLLIVALAHALYPVAYAEYRAASVTHSVLSPQSSVLGPGPASQFGVAGVMRWPDWGTFGAPANLLLRTGAAWVREDFAWSLIEPRPGQFSWTATDRIVGNLSERNLSVLGIISYSVNWATPATQDDNDPSPLSFYPPDHAKFARFVETLVARYKHAVRHWEVWNEPDNPLFWKPAPDPRRYAELLKVAYAAIKRADPSAVVLTGGVSGNAIPFLEELEAAGAGNAYDILAIHPYAVPLSSGPEARIQAMPEVHKLLEVELAKYRAFLQRHNHPSRPIWITEIGWPARDWALTSELQATYLAQAYAQLLSSGLVQRIFWYSFKDSSSDPADSWGLIAAGAGQTDLSPRRPSFAAYTTAATLLTGAQPAGQISFSPSTSLLDFSSPSNWSRSNHPQGTFVTGEPISDAHSSTGQPRLAAKLTYNFTAPNQAVDFAPPQPLALQGKPTRLSMRVKGDASGNYLSAWLRDRDGELFKLRMGAVTGPADGYRYYEARIGGYYFDWEHTGGSPSNGRPDYPLSLVALRLENTPDEPPGSGTIYIAELASIEGPDASAFRFLRQDGVAVDVLWAATAPDQPHVTLAIPTAAKSVQLVGRDGQVEQLQATNGLVTLSLTDEPLYLVHKPVPAQEIQYAGAEVPTTTRSPLCSAARRADPATAPGNLYFPETGHNLSGPFRRYWEANGGIAIFGYPITELFSAPVNGGKALTQQYFQRARFELHPEAAPPYDVQLGLLGVWTVEGRSFQSRPAASARANALHFRETDQTLSLFRGWWESNGGLPVFGFPISPELEEKSLTDGKLYTVQYFERNRLEYHPEAKGGPYEVQLGLLGSEFVARQDCK